MRPHRAGCVVLLIWIVFLLGTGPAWAGDDDAEFLNTAIHSDVQSAPHRLTAFTAGLRSGNRPNPVSGTGAEPWVLACDWFQLADDELGPYLEGTGGVSGRPVATPSPDTGDGPVVWSIVRCDGVGTLNYWPTGGVPPQNIIDWLVARARASVVFPVPVGQAAPFGDSDAPLITQLPTWLWVDPSIWAPVSATPAPVFGYSTTATATPVNVAFTANDMRGRHRSEVVNCGANLGPPYSFGLPDDAQRSE